MTIIDILSEKLVGKKLKHRNQYNRDVVLEVESVKNSHKHRQITPDTPENDWYGQSADWDVVKITFTDGSNIEVTNLTKLEIES